MIIWFDNNLIMHVDKTTSAENSFALSKYVPKDVPESKVVFKANAVVSGGTVLFTHTQVTRYAKRLFSVCYSQTTVRQKFLKAYLSTIENSICHHLISNGYRKAITIRFKVGQSASELFEDKGYRYYKNSGAYYCNSGSTTSIWSEFVIVEKTI